MATKPETIFQVPGKMAFVAKTIVSVIRTMVFVNITMVETLDTMVMVAKKMVLVAKTMACKVFTIGFVIVAKRWLATGRGSTAFVSTISGGFVSNGRKEIRDRQALRL
jgi:hypothetical protein